MSDDKSLDKAKRKRLRMEHSSHLSDRATLIKIADKTCNVRDIGLAPPRGWNAKRRAEYLECARRVVDGCRGVNRRLERFFDETLANIQT